jgi:ferric-dicitrate binding protein FerR (iron transport regulator)
VAAGDVVTTHSAPATIEFLDGSRVILAEDSKASIEAKAGRSLLRFLQGSGEYNLSAHPSLSVFVLDKQAAAKSTNGPVRLCLRRWRRRP